jgi:isoleucyl-tRNA synthetase
MFKLIKTRCIGSAVFRSSKARFCKNINDDLTDTPMIKNVNIPTTDYNDRLNLKEIEHKNIDRLTNDFYKTQYNSQALDKSWVTHDGPPFTTGKPHLGNLMNKVYKDVINRIKIMQGYKVDYRLGFDCYGQQVEDAVLKKSIKIKEIEDLYEAAMAKDTLEHRNIHLEEERITKIREVCREFVHNTIMEHLGYYKRLGIMFDSSSLYNTSSPSFEVLQLELFKLLLEKGLIYRDHRVIYWSANEQRILNHQDIDEKVELSDSIIVKFKVNKMEGNCSEFQQFENLNFLGFLSEPWKYVGVRALAISDKNFYCICKIDGEHFICAYKRLPELAKRYNNTKPEILYSAVGNEFLNMTVVDPLFNREIPIIVDKGVSQYYGTGVNIFCPAHDYVDEKLCAEYKLSQEGYVDENNNFKRGLGFYFYKTNIFTEGNFKIINKLQKNLFLSWKYENKYYTVKDTNERVSLRSISSWFLKIDPTLKARCMKELTLANYYPDLKFDHPEEEKDRYVKRNRKKDVQTGYKNLIEELDDIDEWCISEINSWGSPIPYFINTDDGSEVMNSEIIEHFQRLITAHGSDIWWKYDISDLLPDKYKHLSDKLAKGKENFESWFNSGISWYVLNNISQYIEDPILVKKLQDNGILTSTQGLNRVDKNSLLKEYLKHLSSKFTKLTSDELTEVESIMPTGLLIDHINSKRSNPQAIDPPSSIVVEGYDQHFSWFLYSILTSVSFNHQGYFANLKTHGMITNSAGKKISKSSAKGYIDPLDVVDGTMKISGERQYGYGADILRLYFCKNDSDRDYKLYEEDLVKAKEELKVIKRTAKLCLGYLDDYNTQQDSLVEKGINSFDSFEILEQIMIYEYIKYLNTIEDSVKAFELDKYYRETYKFVNDILSGYYIDSARHYLINNPVDDKLRRRIQYVLKEVFYGVSLTLTPVIPFNAENIYSYINFLERKKDYINLERLPTSEQAIAKFKYTHNADFNFNADNLLIIRRQLVKKDSRNEFDLHIFNEEDSYENMLIKTLGRHVNYFFGVSHCFLNSELAGKKSNYNFKTKTKDGRQKIKVSLDYSLQPSDKFKCNRCLFKTSSSLGGLCENCERILYKI